MKPAALLVGRLPNVIANVAKRREHPPLEWPDALNREEVFHQLDR